MSDFAKNRLQEGIAKQKTLHLRLGLTLPLAHRDRRDDPVGLLLKQQLCASLNSI